MRVADLQVDKLLAGIFWFFGCCGGFDCGSVADADEAENGDVAF
jgi:hypothetical protein